jgi:septal ring factor EnvC (AmiA/AmiB activator)
MQLPVVFQETAMITETPQTLLLITVGTFVFGWIVAKVGSYFGARASNKQRDPRDDRIRSLEADLRVAHSSVEKIKAQLEDRGTELSQTQKLVAARAASFGELEDTIVRLRTDLKDSVKKTRELRAELTDRAAENVRSEVKLREIEAELSVAQASTDLLSAGMLDYNVPENEETPDEALDPELPAFRAGA